ncbi:MAG: hypothetical protein IJP48_09050 [Synergistaceae bacterium]|nr:hypothetical protein [Synergistaceae bacterium]
MNIGENFYCSRCLKELNSELGDEVKCTRCGYDPFDSKIDSHALEEGTTLNQMRFHIGAVRRKTKSGYIYGAFDYVKQRPVYIFEYFPDCVIELERDKLSCCNVIVPAECEDAFANGKRNLINALNNHHKIFAENNTLYVFRK